MPITPTLCILQRTPLNSGSLLTSPLQMENQHIIKRFIALLLCISSFFAGNSQTLETVNGVQTILFESEKGSIYIYLPNKIVANKNFSGSIAIYPNGNSKREESKNLKRLKNYQFTINNKSFVLSDNIFSLQSLTSTATVSLSTEKGKNIGSTEVEFSMKPPISPKDPISFPKHIANEVNASFYGAFDGKLDNTTVSVNGKRINVVAESPVQLCLRPDDMNSTLANVIIKDGDNTHQGQCNAIYYTLKIGPTTLKRGRSTFFDATIHGVGTIEKPLTYTVVNNTTSIVRLGGGNSQTFTISPNEHENGNWFHHFDIKSISTGSFTLTTNLVIPDTPYPDNSEELVTIRPHFQKKNIDCRIYNQSFFLTNEQCSKLGGAPFNNSYTPTENETEAFIETSEVEVNVIQDENEVELQVDIKDGDLPEMVVSTIKPLNAETKAAIKFLTAQQQSYSLAHKNQSFGNPNAAEIETTLLYSNGSSQIIHTNINFSGNPFYSMAKSAKLTEIRTSQNRLKGQLNSAVDRKKRLEEERNKTRKRYLAARAKHRKNNSNYGHLLRIDQSLEKVRPAFADSLKVLIDSLNSFKKRTGGRPNKANTKRIEDNLRDAKKAHQDCLDQANTLQKEHADLKKQKEALKEQQKQIHRDIMNEFRSTDMDFAGSTRRDKNGKFHYQYGAVTVSSNGTATYHKGGLPAQIAPQVSALEKQMKGTTDKLNAVSERLTNIPGELDAKNKECAALAKKLQEAEDANKRKDALAAEDQYWNTKIDALCSKIKALLNQLRIWAKVNDSNLLSRIDNVRCGDNIWIQIDGIVQRKKSLEAGFKGDASNARRDEKNAEKRLEELGDKIKEEIDKIRAAQKALLASQKAEAIAAKEALAKDKEKCLEIMRKLGYKATSIADAIDLYEISQDLKKAADEAQNAMENLKKAVEFGGKKGLDTGRAKKWVKKTQDRLNNISKKLAKLEKYKNLAEKVKGYADRIGKLIGSDGTPTQNAEAFGEGLKFMNEALDAIADKLPILKVFAAYFTFITESYGAIMNGANDAVRKQYQRLLRNVKSKMRCNKLMQVCRSNGDDIAKIKDWAYNEYVVKPGYDALRRDQTQAKKIISQLVEQRMAECCFKRLQAIRAAN